MHWTVVALAMVVHVEHEATFDDNEYKPAAQRVHVVAPALVPVFVIEPAGHEEHEVTFDDNEYKPGVQGEHVDVPPLVPIVAMEPGPHEARTM